MSASLATYLANLKDYIGVLRRALGIKVRLYPLVDPEDVYTRELRKRVKVFYVDGLRDVRVHKFLRYLPSWLLRGFKYRFDKAVKILVDWVKSYEGVVIITQNKLSAEVLSKIFSGTLGIDPTVFDSGYYFKSKLLVTWLRSKLNRGVNVHDVAPSFVPRFFVFCGTFLSSIKKVVGYDYSELPGDIGYIMFTLQWVDRRYFVVYSSDLIYETEVLCWIDQFIGRALRVSRSYETFVYVFMPRLFSYGRFSMYLFMVERMPDSEDVERAREELLRRLEKAKREGDDEEVERLRKRLYNFEEFFDNIGVYLRWPYDPKDVKKIMPRFYRRALALFLGERDDWSVEAPV